MSSQNTVNETSNQTASASIVYYFFVLPQNLKFPNLLPHRIVTFRVSPNPSPKPNPLSSPGGLGRHMVAWNGGARDEASRGAGVAQSWHT